VTPSSVVCTALSFAIAACAQAHVLPDDQHPAWEKIKKSALRARQLSQRDTDQSLALVSQRFIEAHILLSAFVKRATVLL
jgi:hypothetical protein